MISLKIDVEKIKLKLKLYLRKFNSIDFAIIFVSLKIIIFEEN
jgi:hypothetical protein